MPRHRSGAIPKEIDSSEESNYDVNRMRDRAGKIRRVRVNQLGDTV
jgi:hypothetical protein